MSSCLEFEGKVVEKALQKASEALNIPKEKIKYNVVSYGSSGIFGLVGAKKAKICVTLPEKSKSKTVHRPDKKSTTSSSPGSDQTADSNQNSPPEAEPSKSHKEPPSEPAFPSASALVREAFDLPPDSDEPPDEDSAVSESEEAADTKSEPPPEKTLRITPEPETELSDPLELGKDALQRIIDFITTDAVIHVEQNGDRFLLNIQGGNPGVLIGKKGQTLEAIQYLVEKIVNRHSDKRIRIQVDVEGYLENRRSNLRSLAKRLADKTKQSGKPSTLGQMNAHDRRIVHLTLKDNTEVRTQSIGEGFYRKLVIFPKKKKKRS